MKRTVLRVVTLAAVFALVLPCISMAIGNGLVRPRSDPLTPFSMSSCTCR